MEPTAIGKSLQIGVVRQSSRTRREKKSDRQQKEETIPQKKEKTLAAPAKVKVRNGSSIW